MLEQLAGDGDVEASFREVERLVEVGPVGLDPELRRFCERLAVGVDADDLIARGVGPGQRAVATAEVEDSAPGAADVAPEERLALGPREDEAGAPFAAVVLGIPLAQLIEAHERRLVHRPRLAASPGEWSPAARAGQATKVDLPR